MSSHTPAVIHEHYAERGYSTGYSIACPNCAEPMYFSQDSGEDDRSFSTLRCEFGCGKTYTLALTERDQ